MLLRISYAAPKVAVSNGLSTAPTSGFDPVGFGLAVPSISTYGMVIPE